MSKVMAINFSMRSHNDINMDIAVLFAPLLMQPSRLPDFLSVTVNVPTTRGENYGKEIRAIFLLLNKRCLWKY